MRKVIAVICMVIFLFKENSEAIFTEDDVGLRYIITNKQGKEHDYHILAIGKEIFVCKAQSISLVYKVERVLKK